MKRPRKKADEESERFRLALDLSADGIYLVDRASLRYIDVNESACRTSGYPRAELLTKGPLDLVVGLTRGQLERTYDELIAKSPASMMTEVVGRAKSGEELVAELQRRALKVDGRWMIVTHSRDITQRKKAERAQLRLQNMFAALGSTNEAIIHATSPEELYQRVCDAAVHGGKLMNAAVMIPDPITGWAKAAAVSGHGERRLRDTPISVDAASAEGRGMVGTAFRSRQPCVINDFLNDERTRVWRDSAQKGRIRSGAAVPLVRGGRTTGVLMLFSDAENAFDEDIVALLQRMADNIAFALDNFNRAAERRDAEQALRKSEERFRSLTELSSDWYWEQDAELRFTKFEGKASAGPRREAIIGKRLWELSGIVLDSGFEQRRAALLRREPFRDLEYSYRDQDGEQFHVSVNGQPIFTGEGVFEGYRGTSRDISERRRSEERIQYLATHDGLTGLPNRVMFSELLGLELESARRYARKFAVLFIDLDRFKSINDTLGHAAGDLLLKEMAARLKHALRASDVVARLGGDEFVVLVQEANDPNQVAAVARKILSAAIRPIEIAGQECRVTASIGISLFPGDAQDEQALMKNADLAMYFAKEEGKNNFQFYSKDLKAQSLERLTLEADLRRALEREEFFVHYQAKLNLETNAITGVEALLRWQHPQLGVVAPLQFIPVAEETGLIVPIGMWVLRTACAQNVAWQREGLAPVRMAVNLSPRQFAHEPLLKELGAVLAETGMAPELLELEITESMVMGNIERAAKLLGAIKALGVRLAIDDFGTGYSSLAQLKRFPIDTLKVDRSFIRDIPGNVEDRAITEAIIAMGKTLSLTIVAEGVETAEQQSFLREHACDEIQGFYFSKPVAPGEFAALLRANRAQ